MLRRGVYDQDWIPRCGSGNVYAYKGCGAGSSAVVTKGMPVRKTSDIYHDKLMFMLEELARSERTDADPRHKVEYSRARKRAVDLYLAGKDPDPRMDTHNMQFPMESTLGDEMYGCEACVLDVPPEKVAKYLDSLADPYASPSGMTVADNPYSNQMYGTGYDLGMGN